MTLSYEIPYENIVYFPEVVPDIQNLINTIELTNGYTVSPWETWYAYGETTDPYGEIKFIQGMQLARETDSDIKKNSEYILKTLVDSMTACATEYSKIYKIDKESLDFALYALNLAGTKFGINKYFEGQYMGPHVDWNEYNSDITYTIVVYLNDDYEGGELYFVDPNINVKIKPKAGSIVMFPSKLPYLHQSCQITKGRKMLITHHWKNNSLNKLDDLK